MIILCPHCQEPLIIRCYYERWVDFGQEIAGTAGLVKKEPYLMYNEADMHDASDLGNNMFGDVDEFNDYECAKCKGDVKEYIGMPIKDLPVNMKGGDDK